LSGVALLDCPSTASTAFGLHTDSARSVSIRPSGWRDPEHSYASYHRCEVSVTQDPEDRQTEGTLLDARYSRSADNCVRDLSHGQAVQRRTRVTSAHTNALVTLGMVGLAGLEPAASSLSGFCPQACFRRIAPGTCANDVPLETAGRPLGSDGLWTKHGPSHHLAGLRVSMPDAVAWAACWTAD